MSPHFLSNSVTNITSEYCFKESETFSTYEELKERLALHSKHDFVYYWRRDSRTVDGAQNKTSRPISRKLKYYSMRFACVFGGQKFSPRGKGKRSTQSMRTDCPAFITFRASYCGNYLEVASVCNAHNHEISEVASKYIPQHRKLSADVREEVLHLLMSRIDKHKIIEYVQLRTGIQLITKNIYNFATKLKSYDKYEVKDAVYNRIHDFIDKKDTLLSGVLRKNRREFTNTTEAIHFRSNNETEALEPYIHTFIDNNQPLSINDEDGIEEIDIYVETDLALNENVITNELEELTSDTVDVANQIEGSPSLKPIDEGIEENVPDPTNINETTNKRKKSTCNARLDSRKKCLISNTFQISLLRQHKRKLIRETIQLNRRKQRLLKEIKLLGHS